MKGRSFEGDLDYEKTESSTVAWNIYAGAAAKSAPVSLGVGYSEVYQKSSSQTMCSFMDMDRDGLVDLVETGKSTYFKNMGDFTFEERNIYSNVSVSDVTVKVSDEEKKEYRQTYYVQTPFRMWKSPYEGIVTITETASRRADNFESAHKVDLKTFVGASQNPVSELGMTVSSTTPVSKEKSGIEIEKGTNYYFISDNGIEPSGTDLNWNINIEYTDIKSFKVSDVQPFMNLESFYEITGDERAYDKKEDAKKGYPAIFAREKLNGALPLADMFSYPIREVEHENNGVKTYTYYISAVYNRTWPKSITDEEQKKAIVSILMKKNLLMPRVLTETQFNEYLKEVQKEKNIGEFKEKKDYYQAFAQQFTHSIPDNLYTLKKFDDDAAENNKKATEFFKTFPMPENVQKGALQNYVRNGIMPSFSVDKAYYLNQKNQDFDKARSLDENGTLSGNLIVAGTYDSAVIYIDRCDNKLKRCVQSGDTKTYESVDIPYDIKLKPTDLDEFTVQYGFNIDEKKVYESTVNISFKGLSYRAENLSAEEFQKIYDHIEVDYSKASDSHWNLPDTEDKEERQKRKSLDFLFEDMELLTGAQREGIISALYELKNVYEEKASTDGSTEPKLLYQYYAIKENPDYVEAQAILDAYKKEVIMQEKYPFYNEDENGEYHLKDEWKQVKEKKDAQEEWNEEIRNEVAADPEVDAEDPNAVEAAVEKLFEDKYKIYLDMHEYLVSECQYFNFGKYESVAVTQEFNAEYLSKINKNEKSYTLFMAENNLHFTTRKFTLSKTAWNSANDYSFNNINKERGIFTYETLEKAEIDAEHNPVEENIKTEIMISNEEFLYGGVNSWYYGIWKGSLADVPFTEDKLLEFKKDVGTFESKEAFEEKKNSVPQTISEDDKKQKKEDTVHFYMPQKISESAYPNGIDKSLVSSLSDGSEVDLNKSLIGIVATYTEIKKVNGVKQSVDEYFIPYIFGDVIHADRAGGKSYYKIEGLKEEVPPSTQIAKGSPLAMPAVRKSYVSGTDKTPTAKAGIGPVTINISDSKNESTGNTNFNLAVSGPMGGGSVGSNKSVATSQQIIQDLNADGIPDIVRIDSSSLKITEGKKVNEIGEVCYDEGSTISGIEYISKNETNTTTMGGSVSAQGSTKVVPTASSFGNIKNVQVEVMATPSASGGLTYSRGSSEQSHGLGDINGDGIPDYYDGKAYRLSNGSRFMSDYKMFGEVSKLSESNTYSVGTNFSLPIGSVSASGDLAEAKSLRNGATGTVGVTYNSSSSNVKQMMMDINGDGLQDILRMEPGSTSITVRYNTGNKFTEPAAIELPDWTNKNGFNYVNGNLSNFLWSDSKEFDLGVIGDVPVIGSVVSSEMRDIAINPFGFGAKNFANSLDWNTSISLGLSGSVGLNVDIAFRFFVILAYVGTLNITFSGGAGVNASTSLNGANVKMADLDGDGLADHVLRVPGLGTYWKRNISGRYGQLVRVNMPQGGNVNIEYTESYGTPSNPNFKYVMSRVTMNDGTDGYGPLPKIEHGAHSLTTVYNYKDGFYDRQRKDFLGFETVTTTNADGTYQVDTYNNRKYYLKGSVLNSVSYAKDGTKLSESETKYMNAPVALPRIEESWTYEKNGDGSCIYTATEYTYDGWGNCTKVVQSYGDGVTLTGEILYDNTETEKYIIGLPVDIVVYGKNGITDFLRHRHGDYNDFGQLIELRQYFGKNTDDYSVNYLTYDDHYGNITSVKDSSDATLSYTYDGYVHSFVTQIDQFGNGTKTYTSNITYLEENIANQTKDSETDCNGNTLHYKYDNWQRIERIWTSYDKKENPAVKYEYHTTGKNNDGMPELWYAITDNKVTFDENDSSVIQTVLQVDGLGRAVRTAKTGFVDGKLGWNVSGAVEYDIKGRTIKEGMTEFIEGSLNNLLDSKPEMTSLFTSYEYDEKDRQIKTVLPDENKQFTSYEITDGKSITYSKDPLGNISIQEADCRGNIVRVAKQDNQGNQLTEVTYRYNAMGEMLKAFDAKEHPITAEYDMLGRRTALESLDSGRQEFIYDKSSNLIFETNSELRDHNKQIQYIYDGLNRLIQIDYPDTKDTLYKYGDPEDKAVGAAGKILKVEDASGTLEYEYGKLGEVTKERRVLATHLNGPKSEEEAVMQYRSDYLGRMQWIIYPDGEQITYGYDEGGQVVSVTGNHNNIPFTYVSNILYDEYGQRTRIDYGNGTYTVYEYDPARRWLDTINTKNKWGQNYQNIKYSFDAVGNVLGYVNDCLNATSGNYKTEQTYSYDNLYQLINVEGETTYNPSHSVDPEFISKYSQAFSFDTEGLGNMTSKVSKEAVSPDISVGDNLNYNLDYVYDSKYAHRLVRAGTRYYKYDANGNITCEQDGAFEGEAAEVYRKITQEAEDVYSTDYGWGLVRDETSGNGVGSTQYHRTYSWNEKNQLIGSSDATFTTSYIYGQDGQRSNKYTDSSETLYFNKMWTLHTDSGNRDKGGQFAKNIYLGDTRIVTKLKGYEEKTVHEETFKQYFYHSDHLGSASLISDYEGKEYQRIEYTPYGETWVEKTQNIGSEFLPYKFTAKELDEETGLYYYGARYLDPKYSMWISTDPALGEYIPKAPVDEEAKKYNQNLPGMGGVFNHINNNLYHYAGNNPIKYTDPDGKQVAVPSPLGVPIIIPVYPVIIQEPQSPTLLDDGIITKDGRHLLGSGESSKKDVGKNLQDSANAPCPDPDPNDDNDDNDDDTLTPEDIEKYNEDVKEQYNNQLNNSQSSTETPWNPNDATGGSDTPSDLHGWRKFIYFLGKLTELFDNIQN